MPGPMASMSCRGNVSDHTCRAKRLSGTSGCSVASQDAPYDLYDVPLSISSCHSLLFWQWPAFKEGRECNVTAYGSHALETLDFHQEILQRFPIVCPHLHKNTSISGDGMDFLYLGPVGKFQQSARGIIAARVNHEECQQRAAELATIELRDCALDDTIAFKTFHPVVHRGCRKVHDCAEFRIADNIQLLFSDVQMPGGRNGFALARECSERWPNISILVASGQAKPQDGDFPEGATFIGKPFSSQIIHDRLQKLLPDDRKPESLAKRAT